MLKIINSHDKSIFLFEFLIGKEKTISHIKDTLFSVFCRLVLVATQLEINLSSDLTLFEFILG